MFVTDLDGNVGELRFTGNVAARGKRRGVRSGLHLRARDVLKKLFPTCERLEEVEIMIRGRERGYLDFYIPQMRTAVEVQGEQHFKYIAHFHHSTIQFLRQRRKDDEKIEWCKLNNITLYALRFDESDEEWEKTIDDS